jgi:nicotinate-nucleotide pyrophosphorylase (carboxylating)
MSVPPLATIMIEPLVREALLEDLGRAGDLTTDAVVPAGARAETALVARRPGVVAGPAGSSRPSAWRSISCAT